MDEHRRYLITNGAGDKFLRVSVDFLANNMWFGWVQNKMAASPFDSAAEAVMMEDGPASDFLNGYQEGVPSELTQVVYFDTLEPVF